MTLDENVCWDDDPLRLDGFEPWEPDEPDAEVEAAGGCAYCGATELREDPEPFGGQPCCESCFAALIGDADGPPWRCGTAP